MKKVIAFDLDRTLTESKSPLPERIGILLDELLEKFEVCVISGGRFEQFEKQLLNNLKTTPAKLKRFHLMPVCGTRYYIYDSIQHSWKQVYAEDFTPAQKDKIISALNEGIDALGYRETKTWGEIIEDRGSQITFSALGQDIVEALGSEGIRLKEAWDPDITKRAKLQKYVAKRIPEFEVRVGGGSSVDITKPGIDKAYGMKKLIEMLDIKKEDILFIGDRLQEGGNDYPIKAMGVDSIEISHWQETALTIQAILYLS